MRTLIILTLVSLLVSTGLSVNITLNSGMIYFAFIQHSIPTERWVGLRIRYADSAPSNYLFFNKSGVYNLSLKGGDAVIIIPKGISFNIKNFRDISLDDLDENKIFSEKLFPIFYPDYNSYYDNPKNTFCCKLVRLDVGGRYFNSFQIEVEGQKEYLSNYDGYPAFILIKSSRAILPVNASFEAYTVKYTKNTRTHNVYPLPCFEFTIIGNSTNVPTFFYVYTYEGSLEGVNITIYNNSKIIAWGSTDNNGIFIYSFKSPGIYKITFKKSGYCTKQTAMVIYSPPIYKIKINNKYIILGKPECFSVYKNEKQIRAKVYLLFPNQSLNEIVVNGTKCIIPKSPGKYYVILSNNTQISQSFTVIQVLPNKVLYLIIKTWRFLYILAEILIVLTAGIISIIITILKMSEKFKINSGSFNMRR